MEAQDAELAKMLQDKERIKAKRAKERARQKKLERQQRQAEQDIQQDDQAIGPDKLDKSRAKSSQQYPDPDEIYVLEESIVDADVREVTNVAAIIDPTYNAQAGSSSGSSPGFNLPSSSQELDEISSTYMPVQGQRRSHNAFPSPPSSEEKHKRRLGKDGCKQQ